MQQKSVNLVSKKDFHTKNHQRSLLKLDTCAVGGTVLTWLKSFFKIDVSVLMLMALSELTEKSLVVFHRVPLYRVLIDFCFFFDCNIDLPDSCRFFRTIFVCRWNNFIVNKNRVGRAFFELE